jgi:hypothetical protein
MDFSNHTVVIVAYIFSNLLALGMLWLCWKRSNIARLLFFMLFIWAGFTNAFTSVNNPKAYLEYADYALLAFYKSFINGFFSQHITVIVFSIAIGQILTGMFMFMKGIIFKLGCAGGILFLLAITPLGIGSGSPAPFVWAVGLFMLYKKRVDKYWWCSFKKKTDVIPAQNIHKWY